MRRCCSGYTGRRVKQCIFQKEKTVSEAILRRSGRRALYPGHVLIQQGIAILPDQRDRLNDFAATNGTTLSAVVRNLITQWEQETFPSGA